MGLGGAISSAMQVLGVSGWVSSVAGPILDKELRVTSRRRFTYVLRSIYLALLAGFIVLAWVVAFRGTRGTPLSIASEMAEAGKTIIATLALFQFAVLPLVAVLVLSGSISEEIDRRTLGVLLATPVTALQVVIGKLASRLLHLVLLLAASVPAMVVIRILGGVPAEYILASTCITLTTILFCGMLTLYLSIGDRRPWRVTLKAIAVIMVGFVLLPLLAVVVLHSQEDDLSTRAILLFDPAFAAVGVMMNQLWPSTQGPQVDWHAHCGVMLCVTALLFVRSVYKVRRVALAQAAGDEGLGRASGRARRPAAIRRVFGAPVIWKEIRRRSFRSRRRSILAWGLALGILVLTYAFVGRDLGNQDPQLAYGIALLVVGMLSTAVLAAPAVASEKESQTLMLLLVTPLAGAEIILGKAVGILWRSLPMWSLLFLHLALATAFGVQSPWAFLHSGLLVAGVAVFLTGSGIFFSTLMKKTTSAVVASLMLPIFFWGLFPGGLVLLSEFLAVARDEVELVVCFDPVVLMGIIMLGTRRSGAVGEDYRWPSAMGHLSMIESTLVILMIAATYAAIGVVLAALASDRLRTRARRR